MHVTRAQKNPLCVQEHDGPFLPIQCTLQRESFFQFDVSIHLPSSYAIEMHDDCFLCWPASSQIFHDFPMCSEGAARCVVAASAFVACGRLKYVAAVESFWSMLFKKKPKQTFFEGIYKRKTSKKRRILSQKAFEKRQFFAVPFTALRRPATP